MISHEFTKEIENKKYAQKFFPDYIRPDFTIVSAKTVEELEKDHRIYSEYFKEKFGDFLEEKISPLARARSFLLSEKEREKETSFTHLDIQELFNTYERLLFSIGQYEFTPRHRESSGESQNKTNQNMLLELSMFRSFVIGVLKKLDKSIPTDESEDFNDFNWGLLNYVEDFTTRLDLAENSLYEKEELYHETWRQAKQPSLFEAKASLDDLGKARREWRKEKNNACHELLMFFKALSIMNSMLNQEENLDDELDKRFHDAIENIKKGPNYYSYLSELCKKHDIEAKTYIKKQKKENH